MGCNSAIYIVNPNDQVITTQAGTFVQAALGSVIRRFGKSLVFENNQVYCAYSGYYKITALVEVTPSATGEVTAKITENGSDIVGASTTISGTADEISPIPIYGIVRNCGCSYVSALSLLIDAPVTVNNVTLIVEKL